MLVEGATLIDLPVEILCLILLRLPFKDIIRCKLVGFFYFTDGSSHNKISRYASFFKT